MSKFTGFHVGEYIADEIEARGWTRRDLAERMGGDVAVNLLTLDLLIDLPSLESTLGQETADALSLAFGTSSVLWMKLDASWRAENGATQ